MLTSRKMQNGTSIPNKLRDLIAFLSFASFMAQIVKGARWHINTITAAIPFQAIINKRYHKLPFNLSKELRETVWKLVGLLEQDYTYKVEMQGKTYTIYTDASDTAGGVSTKGGQGCTISLNNNNLWKKLMLQDENERLEDVPILIKEMFVILLGVLHTRKKSCLRLHTDSQAAIATLSKGVCRSQKVNNIVDRFWSTCRKRQVTPVLYYVNTNENPADGPSRKPPGRKGIP